MIIRVKKDLKNHLPKPTSEFRFTPTSVRGGPCPGKDTYLDPHVSQLVGGPTDRRESFNGRIQTRGESKVLEKGLRL